MSPSAKCPKSTYRQLFIPEERSIRVQTRSGFFGLTQLSFFAGKQITPLFNEKIDKDQQTTYILDFSDVKVWDISAILWLIIGLHFYKKSGVSFKLRLPDPKNGTTSREIDEFQQSADYLRRWRFDLGLNNIVSDISSLLVESQYDYFVSTNQKYYKSSNIKRDGLTEQLVSRRLAHIWNLSNVNYPGIRSVDENLIADCIKSFERSTIEDILVNQCAIEKLKASQFSGHLVLESLLNVLEHPDATIGMLSISKMGNSNELILAIADNGKSIPSTIYKVFLEFAKKERIKFIFPIEKLPDIYSRNLILAEKDLGADDSMNTKNAKAISNIIDFATSPGITRMYFSDPDNFKKRGWGLTYIKEDTLETFKGNLFIISDGVKLVYRGGKNGYEDSPYDCPWEGNLIRISIPTKA